MYAKEDVTRALTLDLLLLNHITVILLHQTTGAHPGKLLYKCHPTVHTFVFCQLTRRGMLRERKTMPCRRGREATLYSKMVFDVLLELLSTQPPLNWSVQNVMPMNLPCVIMVD